MDVDVKMTAEAIDEMADNFRHYARELDFIAKKMRERQDIEYAGEALQAVKNCFSNTRIELLAVRPIREYQRMERNRTE